MEPNAEDCYDTTISVSHLCDSLSHHKLFSQRFLQKSAKIPQLSDSCSLAIDVCISVMR